MRTYRIGGRKTNSGIGQNSHQEKRLYLEIKANQKVALVPTPEHVTRNISQRHGLRNIVLLNIAATDDKVTKRGRKKNAMGPLCLKKVNSEMGVYPKSFQNPISISDVLIFMLNLKQLIGTFLSVIVVRKKRDPPVLKILSSSRLCWSPQQ